MINININKDWIPFIVIAALAFLLLGQCSANSSLREDKALLKQEIVNAKSNLEASQDSVEIYKTQNGYLEAEIKVYVASGEDLADNYSDMVKKYQRVLRLNKKLEGVNALLTSEIELKDSLLIATNINPDSTFRFVDSVDYGDNNSRVVTLEGKIDSAQVTGKISIYQTLTLLTALEQEDGYNRMRISTKYPFNDINIEGIDLINNELNTYRKKARWNMNFGVGLGLYPNDGFVSPAPFVGVTLGYSPKWLQF